MITETHVLLPNTENEMKYVTLCSFCALMSLTVSHRVLLSDLRHSGERPVGRHDGQREAAALVPADGGGIPGPALRQLHHQLEGWQTLQRHHTQTQVRC